MCLFCKGEKEELGVGGVGRGRRGDSRVGGGGTEWGTVKGALLQSSSISQLWIHVWITDVAWGEWWTNAGSEAMRGVLITRFELTCNPQPLRALCLLLLTPKLVGTSRGVCLGFLWSYSGDLGREHVFWVLLSVFVRSRPGKYIFATASKIITKWTQMIRGTFSRISTSPKPVLAFLTACRRQSVMMCSEGKKRKTY